MTEDKPVETVEDTGLSETVDTSTNEETQDTESDADDMTFGDLEFDTEESDDTEDTEAATEESEEETEESEGDVEEEAQPTESNDAEQKRIAYEAYKQREAARLAKQQELRESQMEYLQDAEDDRDLALRQLQIDAYNNRIQANADKIEAGIQRAVAEIELFRTAPEDVREALASSLDEFEQLHVSRDQQGNVVEVRADVNQFLHQRAEVLKKIMEAGARQQAKAKSQTQARTTITPSKAPAPKKVDSDLEDFDKVFW